MRGGILDALIYCTHAFIRQGIHELADTYEGINDDVRSMDIETSPGHRLTRVMIQAEGRVILLVPGEYSFLLAYACIYLQGRIYILPRIVSLIQMTNAFIGIGQKKKMKRVCLLFTLAEEFVLTEFLRQQSRGVSVRENRWHLSVNSMSN